MNADISRSTFHPENRYTRVVMQQGRPLLDADFNEQADILLHLTREFALALLGECCAVDKGAFELAPVAGGAGFDFQIGPGTIYVHGIACKCSSQSDEQGRARNFRFLDQFGGMENIPAPPDGWCFVFLDVWERSVTAATNPDLADCALGGADTAARTRVLWRVRIQYSVVNPANVHVLPRDKEIWDLWDSAGKTAMNRGAARFRLAPSEGDAPGYAGAENQLCRAEIHMAAPDGYPLQVKYSRNNASTLFPIKEMDQLNNGAFQLISANPADPLLPAIGDWVEVVTDYDAERRHVGELGQLVDFDPDTGAGRIQAKDRSYYRPARGFIRYWDGVFNVKHDDSWTSLGDGLQISFGPGQRYGPGDYWLAPARVGRGLLIPQDTPRAPDGPVNYQVPIGAIHVKIENGAPRVVDAQTLRPLFERTRLLSWPKWSA